MDKMKKKVVLCFMLACMMTAFAGCGSAETKEVAATTAETEEDGEGKGGRSEGAEAEAATEETKSSDVPVLGAENVEGYDGFTYLYEDNLVKEIVENKETGEKKEKKVTVYIPDDKYTKAYGNYASVNILGVDFKAQFEPILIYDKEDYLPEEKLDYYVANEYRPAATRSYKDLLVNLAERTERGAVATVEYCKYDHFDEVYYAVFCTYYLAELESGESILVEIKVKSNDVTDKTEELIEELEQFYQFDIYWDEEKANHKIADYIENGPENTQYIGNLLFELPEGWEKDSDLSSYDIHVYAPEGDCFYSGCMLAFAKEFISSDEESDVRTFIDEGGWELLKEVLGDSSTDYTTELCDTAFGQAVKVMFAVEYEEIEAKGVWYIVVTDKYIYYLIACDTQEAVESAAMVLDGIMATGQLIGS